MKEYRIYLKHSESEWRCVENQISNYGFTDIRNFVHSRIRKQFKNLPDTFGKEDKKILQSFTISDPEIINRIENYCNKNLIPPSALVRRLATDPLVLKCLLGEQAFDF